jgi:hypothetical protein
VEALDLLVSPSTRVATYENQYQTGARRTEAEVTSMRNRNTKLRARGNWARGKAKGTFPEELKAVVEGEASGVMVLYCLWPAWV